MLKCLLPLTAALIATASAPALAQTPDGVAVKDYPEKSRKLGEEGVVHYQVQISPRGELESCAVTRSSGHARLDAATCQLLVRQARFERKGERYTYDGQVVWKL